MSKQPEELTTYKRVSWVNTLNFMSLGGFWLSMIVLVMISMSDGHDIASLASMQQIMLVVAIALILCGSIGGAIACFASGNYQDRYSSFLKAQKNTYLSFIVFSLLNALYVWAVAAAKLNELWLLPPVIAIWIWYHYKVIIISSRFHKKADAHRAAAASNMALPLHYQGFDFYPKEFTPSQLKTRVRWVSILSLISLGGFWSSVLMIAVIANLSNRVSTDTEMGIGLWTILNFILIGMGFLGGMIAAFTCGDQRHDYQALLTRYKNIFLFFIVGLFASILLGLLLQLAEVTMIYTTNICLFLLWIWYHVAIIRAFRAGKTREASLQNEEPPASHQQSAYAAASAQPAPASTPAQPKQGHRDGNTRRVNRTDLLFIVHGRSYEMVLDNSGLVIGRLGDGEGDWIETLEKDAYISREHFKLTLTNAGVVINCLSANGMSIDQEALTSGEQMTVMRRSTLQISIGQTQIMVSIQ